MAIFDRLSQEEIHRDFEYYGLLYGIVPVYVADPDGRCPKVCVRNWVPECTLDLVQAIADVMPGDEIMIKIIGKIEK